MKNVFSAKDVSYVMKRVVYITLVEIAKIVILNDVPIVISFLKNKNYS